MKTTLAFVLFLPRFLLASASLAFAAESEPRADHDRQWRRGNVHTHSHWSDGDDYLESIAAWYREHEYDFLVFTDHNVLADKDRWVRVDKTKGGREAYDKLKAQFPDWIDERGDGDALEVRLRRFDEVAKRMNQAGEFLLIPGEEISDAFERAPIHMNVSNVKERIEPQHGRDVFDTIQRNVRAAQEQRERTGQTMMIHLNHPNFGYAVTAEDLMRVQGERFFEVFNGHPGVHNHGDHTHAGVEQIWDIILAHRLAVFDLPLMYGLAVDDGHSYHGLPNRQSNPGRGWVMVLCDKLEAGSLIESMERGDFYASSGVRLESVACDDAGMTITVAPEPGENYTIEFIGTRQGTDLTGQPVLDDRGEPLRATRIYSDKVGEVLAKSIGEQASYAFQGDELYVRARVTSSQKHPNPSEEGDFKQAWVQPVLGPGVE
ncbi:PHP domain protein [Posidoniimonas polymericola]|uniref:PHP domain protein n=1 Tax=Posidoniimonas polymericola TaxID=2528002 RepID=A0A5C5YEW9_9BACT|nr:hypothetical protein [Posidoniimonas polymericola]TWT73604.1 PHP domain protein [Posidoniimonas polymericola]